MHIPSGSYGGEPAAAMIVKHLGAVALLLGLGSALGSCVGGASENGFSAYVADHWPHWAGGMPADVPPRPGTPGYNEFISHGLADKPPSQQSGGAAKPAPSATAAVPAAPAAPPDNEPAEDSNVRQGGLY